MYKKKKLTAREGCVQDGRQKSEAEIGIGIGIKLGAKNYVCGSGGVEEGLADLAGSAAIAPLVLK